MEFIIADDHLTREIAFEFQRPFLGALARATGAAENRSNARQATSAEWSVEDWQSYFDERAGITEFDGGLPRAEAEARAFDCCVVRWLQQKSGSYLWYRRKAPVRPEDFQGAGRNAKIAPVQAKSPGADRFANPAE